MGKGLSISVPSRVYNKLLQVGISNTFCEFSMVTISTDIGWKYWGGVPLDHWVIEVTYSWFVGIITRGCLNYVRM